MLRFLVILAALVALAAVARADINPPGAISDLTAATGHTTAVLSWHEPADACNNNAVSSYDVRMSTSTIDACNFEAATALAPPAPGSPGNLVCFPIHSLSSCTTYYFAVRSRDTAGNWSAMSNVPNHQTSCSGSMELECLWVPQVVGGRSMKLVPHIIGVERDLAYRP
jgi:hypothetical protein